MRRTAVLLLLSAMASTAMWAQEVQRVAVGEMPDYGITYSLPLTAVRFTVAATRTDVEAGVYASYAERMLGIKDAPQDDATEWVVKSVAIEPLAVADTSRTYHITFAEKGALPTFYLTNEGTLWSINMYPTDAQTADAPTPAAPTPVAAKAGPSTPTILSEELLKAGSKARAAEVAARQVFRIRESRMDLLTGDVDNLPRDGAGYQVVLDNLQAQEDAYMQLFVGTRTESTVVRTFVVVPTEATAGDVLFRFSRHYGFVDADDLSGEPYKVSVAVTEDNRETPVVVTDKKTKRADHGIAYAASGKARVQLTHDDDVLAAAELPFGQFGHVEQLPVGLFTDKKRNVRAQFNPLTGSITIYEQ